MSNISQPTSNLAKEHLSYFRSANVGQFPVSLPKNHSTETALRCVPNALKAVMDNRQGSALVLIDFSAAVDTINHKIMIQRLHLRYGIVGKALGWLISYLQDRTQRVVIRDASSNTCVTPGVPQGSVLGPLLFSMCVQPIGDIIRAHGLCVRHYADDLQLYCHFDLIATALGATLQRRTALCHLGATLQRRTALCHLGATLQRRTALCHLGATLQRRTALCHLGATLQRRTALCHLGATLQRRTALCHLGATLQRRTALCRQTFGCYSAT